MKMKLLGSHYEEQKKTNAGFVLIGAGLPRTGTSSTRAALAILLDGACYHMVNVFGGTKEDWNHWDRALDEINKKEKTITDEEWVDFFQGRGFRSGVDYPPSLFYRELMQAFPNAKVLLTVRDNGEGWYKSVKESIYNLVGVNADFACSTFMRLIGSYRASQLVERISSTPPKGFKKGMFEVVGSSKEETVEFYNKWNDEVKRTVPADRLLVFNVKQGWKPLCDFLGVPVPNDIPFPNVNDTKSMNKMMIRMKTAAVVVVYGLPIAFASLGYIFRESILSYLPL